MQPGSVVNSADLGSAGKHHKDPFHELLELLHELPQEYFGRLVGDFAIFGDQARCELDVCLWSIHLR